MKVTKLENFLKAKDLAMLGTPVPVHHCNIRPGQCLDGRPLGTYACADAGNVGLNFGQVEILTHAPLVQVSSKGSASPSFAANISDEK